MVVARYCRTSLLPLFAPSSTITCQCLPQLTRLLCKLIGSFAFDELIENAWNVAVAVAMWEEPDEEHERPRGLARTWLSQFHLMAITMQWVRETARQSESQRGSREKRNKEDDLVIELSSFVFYKCYHKYSILLITTHNSSPKSAWPGE